MEKLNKGLHLFFVTGPKILHFIQNLFIVIAHVNQGHIEKYHTIALLLLI